MSRVTGQAKLEDGTFAYFEYDGTSDVCVPWLRDTVAEVREHWRGDERHPGCEHGGRPVELYADYGDGFYFLGLACKACKWVWSPDPMECRIGERGWQTLEDGGGL